MADRAPEWTQSHAHAVLRRSSKRLLLFIEGEIARRGGGAVTLYAFQLAAVGSIKVVLPSLSELHGLGLIDWQRLPKRHVISLSERWRDIRTMRDARSSPSSLACSASRRRCRRNGFQPVRDYLPCCLIVQSR